VRIGDIVRKVLCKKHSSNLDGLFEDSDPILSLPFRCGTVLTMLPPEGARRSQTVGVNQNRISSTGWLPIRTYPTTQ
jgi:hypothetical protein